MNNTDISSIGGFTILLSTLLDGTMNSLNAVIISIVLAFMLIPECKIKE